MAAGRPRQGDRIDSLESTVSELQSNVAAVQDTVSGLGDGIKAIEGQIAHVLAKVESASGGNGGNGGHGGPPPTVAQEKVTKNGFRQMTPDEYHRDGTANTDPILQGPVPLDRYGNSLDPEWIKDPDNNRWLHIDTSGQQKALVTTGQDGVERPFTWMYDGERHPVVAVVPITGPKPFTR